MIHTHASLASACATGQQSIVEFLVSLEETDLDALDADGTSPLCAAVTWDFDPIVRLLVDAGCDVNVRNGGTQTTALHVAAIQENGRIAHRLLQAGADANATMADGKRALTVAVNKGSASIVELLVKFKANLEAKGLWWEPLRAGRPASS